MGANGTSFEIGLGVGGAAEVSAASGSLGELESRLMAAGTAATTAADAVKAGELAYKQAESAANGAAKALERIALQSDATRQKMSAAMAAGDDQAFWRLAGTLGKLEQKQTEAATKAQTTADALKAEAAALDKLKTAAGQATDAQSKIAKTFDATKKAAAAAQGSGKVNEIAEGFGKLGGPLGQIGQKAFGAAEGLKKLGASLGSAGPYAAAAVAIVAIVAAVTAVTVAVIVGIAKIALWSVSLDEAANAQRRLADGIAGSVDGGEALNATIDGLLDRVPQSRDELLQMAAELKKSGLAGDDLTFALQDAATKAAELKFGPDFRKELLRTDAQAARFKRNIGEIFRLDSEGLLGALSKIGDLFDKDSASARSIKVVFDSLFQPIIDGATAMIPAIVRAFLQFEILALKALIAIKPYKPELVLVAEAIGILAVGIGVILAGAIALVLVPFAVMAAAMTAGIALFLYFSDTLTGIGGAILDFFGIFDSFDFVSVGTDLILGLAGGITGGAGAVISAITGVVGGAIDSAKGLLGIKSPSTVFADIGMNTGSGMVQGVEGATSGVQGALETMVAPPDMGGGQPATASSGGNTYQIYVDAPGGDESSIRQTVREVMIALLEGKATELGTAVPVGA